MLNHERHVVALLFEREFQTRSAPIEYLEVDPTGRLGLSGVRVFRVRAFRQGRPTRYCYAKVGRTAVYRNETDNLQLLMNEADAYRNYVEDLRGFAPIGYVGDASEFESSLDFVETEKQGEIIERQFKAVCIAFAETEDATQPLHSNPEIPRTLNDHLEDRKNCLETPEVMTGAIVRLIHELYEGIEQGWKGRRATKTIDWKSAYCDPDRDYLRTDRFNGYLARLRSQASFGTHPLKKKLCDLDAYVNAILAGGYRPEVAYRPVHGDLHQRNIIIHDLHKRVHPWLIDFGWTALGHALIDFALLEVSLTIFHFSRLLSDSRLGYLRNRLFDNGISPKSPLLPIERQYVDIIEEIRNAARKEATDWPKEYLVSSILITVGMLGVPTARVPTVVEHACWLATLLNRYGGVGH